MSSSIVSFVFCGISFLIFLGSVSLSNKDMSCERKINEKLGKDTNAGYYIMLLDTIASNKQKLILIPFFISMVTTGIIWTQFGEDKFTTLLEYVGCSFLFTSLVAIIGYNYLNRRWLRRYNLI